MPKENKWGNKQYKTTNIPNEKACEKIVSRICCLNDY
jgi:hypothetical protein